jgi:gliding motility-associated-like protein
MRFLPSILTLCCAFFSLHSYAQAVYAFNDQTIDFTTGQVITEVAVDAIQPFTEEDIIFANDDAADTDEDTDVTFDILSNDLQFLSTIDQSTVDLDPSLPGYQTDITTSDGTFKYDGAGNVAFYPTHDFNGTASINYAVDDNFGNTSNTALIEVTVNSINDPPVITGQTPATLSATEDTNFNITTGNLTITDVDDASFTVIILPGTNYTFSGTTVTPSLNYNGPITVNVKVNDGEDDSNTFGVSVSVAAVNDKPVIVSQTPATISATEDQSFSLSLANFTITDDEGGTYTLSVLPGTNYTFSGLTITPNANYNGPLTVNVKVSDGTDDSNPFGTTVSVASVNDKPVITSQTPATISATEDTNFNISLSNLVISDPDDVSFTLTVLSGTNYTFSGTTIIPAANYNGPLTVNVKVNDGQVDSDPFGLAVSVAVVNDVPSITGQTPATLSATEDTDFSIALSNLIISDPDNSSFTLTILSGTNYTFSGTTITPASNYSGSLTVNVSVSDGTNASATFGVAVSVAGDNDPPSITGQTPATLSATEDTNFGIALSNLIISDPDNSSFTLTVLSGTNYTFSGTTITPALNYNGALTVNVRVSDGTNNSNTFGVAVNVAAVNDAPAITGQTPATLLETEDTNFSISVSNLTISDVDNSSFTLTVLSGTNYTFSGTTITPALNYNGPLTVNVQVSDGTNTSNTFGVAVSVAAVNDTPVITGQTPSPISALENTNFTVAVSNLIISDPDNSSFTMTVLAGANYTFSGTTITPANNYNGPLTVNVQVSDGTNTSATFGLVVSVSAVNDPPVITGQNPATLSATEDTNFNISVSNLVISDPDNSSFTLTVLPGTNYTFSGTTVTPALNYNGTLTVNVRVSDGTNNSNTFGVAVNVAAVNDAPTITAQTPATISATEDTNFSIALSNLTISDPDNSTFTLTVLAGTNYTFSGTTITPAANYSGPLTVNVTVSDGTNTSASFGVSVSVSPVNDKPAITGQTPATISAIEDTNFTISVSNLTISDPDNSTFTLTVLSGTNYTFSGTTITPALNYNGPITVNVKVNDGTVDSDPFGVAVNVAAVNDAPIITGQSPSPISATEDTNFSISVSNLIISDPDNSAFTLTILSGTNYTFSGTTVIPAANFSGTLTVNVKVNDGTIDSAPFGITVNVSGTNDPPTITGQTPSPISATEDTNFSISLSNLIISDPDNSTFTLTVLSGTNYTFSGTTITPAANFNGSVTVNVKVNDGSVDSPTFGVSVSVAAVNDAPVITGQQSLTINEDTQITIALSNLTVTDPDNTYPTGFSFTLTAGANYTIAGNKITPVANFNGTLSVPVTVSDGTNTSVSYNLQITVTPVNDVPVITGQTPLTTGESQPITLTLSQLIVTDPDNTYPDDFTLFVLSSANYTVSGNVVTPNANFSGNLIVKVIVNDGALNSATYNLQIQVNSVNNVPVITGQKSLSVNEDNNITIKLNDLTVVDADNTYPADFTLKVNAGANYTVSGAIVTPAANFNGTLSVSVTVNDGNVDSAPYNLQITVNPVNDAPTITGQTPSPISATEDTNFSISLSNFIISDPDNSTFTLTILSGSNYTFSGTTIIPTTNFNGSLTVNVKVNDGTVDSPTFGVSVNVAPVNDAPTITGQTPSPILATEDTNFSIALSNLIITDPDNSSFALTVISCFNGTVSGSTVTPTANFNGALTVSVKVNDGTVDSAPYNVNVNVAPVNDLPVFTSNPNPDALLATVGELYEYQITVTDEDVVYGDAISFSTTPPTIKPSWTTITVTGPGKAKLSGTPTAASAGSFNVTIRVKDKTNTIVEQSYTLIINTRPIISPINLTTNEDIAINFTDQTLDNGFTDADGDVVAKIKLTQLPKHGSLKLGSNVVGLNNEINRSAFAQLTYTSYLDYSGKDTLYWKASDSRLAYSKDSTYISFVINPVNDAPVISLGQGQDTLKYEIGKGFVPFDTAFSITDADDDSLMLAEIGFRQQFYKPDVDVISFTNTINIIGTFDTPSGVLTLAGKAPLSEYEEFIKSIQYRYTNSDNPKLETKSIYITVGDGKSLSNTVDKTIQLIYTFQDLDIASGFTPNGDGFNDVWEVIKPERKEDLKGSRTSIYDISGRLVFEATGFDERNLWDGSYKGKTVPQGSYFFTIEVVDSKLKSLKKVYKGVVSVLY